MTTPLLNIQLPFWMSGPEATKLVDAATQFFNELGNAAMWPAQQLDPLTATIRVVDLLAWQRNVTRYSGEPEELYRLRVQYAYANACDAGSTIGWSRIFARLGLGEIELEERVTGQDWDIIGVIIDDSQFGYQQKILELIVAEYGRTCRRYKFISRIPQSVTVGVGTFDNDTTWHRCESEFLPVASSHVGLAHFNSNQSYFVARA